MIISSTTARSMSNVYDEITTRHGKYYQFPNFNKEFKNTQSMITVVCPIHGPVKMKTAALLSRDYGCNHCSAFRRILSTKYGIDASNSIMSKVYKFALDNHTMISLIDNTLSRYDRAINVYELFKVTTPSYTPPDLIDRSNTVIVRHKVVYNRTHVEALQSLNDIFKGAFDFPYIEKEYNGVDSYITTVCPIHGSFSAIFSSLNRKTGCKRCSKHRSKLIKQYGKERAFDEMIKMYQEIKKNPHLKQQSDQVTPPTVSQLHLNISNVINEQPSDVVNDMPDCIRSNQMSTAELVLQTLTQLKLSDIKSITIEMNIDLNQETTVVVLKTGKTITIV